MASVKFIVGGQEYNLPPLSFWSLEQCWPAIQSMGTASDIFTKMKAGIRVFAAGLACDPAKVPAGWRVPGDDEATISKIELSAFRLMTKPESEEFFQRFIELLSISGFDPQGEAGATVDQPSQTEAGIPLSQNSSASAFAEAIGTA